MKSRVYLTAHPVPAQRFQSESFHGVSLRSVRGVGRNTLRSRTGGTFNLQFRAKFSNVLNLLDLNTPNRVAFTSATEIPLSAAGAPLNCIPVSRCEAFLAKRFLESSSPPGPGTLKGSLLAKGFDGIRSSARGSHNTSKKIRGCTGSRKCLRSCVVSPFIIETIFRTAP
jgi:hypothetical protein